MTSSQTKTTTAFLYDIYYLEESIQLWLLDEYHRITVLTDNFNPEIFACGEENLLRKLALRLIQLEVLSEKPALVRKTHFYENRPILAMRFRFSKPSFLRTIYQKLYAFVNKLDIYHSDFDITTSYMFTKKIFPLAKLKVTWSEKYKANNVIARSVLTLDLLEDQQCYDYSLPPLRIMNMRLQYSHRLGLTTDNPLLIECGQTQWTLIFDTPKHFLQQINTLLRQQNPDVILSSFGDQCILPSLFRLAQQQRMTLLLDREQGMIQRRIITKGTSFQTYGNMIYKAPSYPLFGRWHIDSSNSFVYKESQLYGIIELARMSKLPVQRMARSSTGTALTYMEVEEALAQNYLIPWQKSSVEEEKTAYDLLQIDKGGLVFEPDLRQGNVFENVAQLDFSQMYPTIMVIHNISPETVLCNCCRNDHQTARVPEANYHLCRRRQGVVSLTLSSILKRRRWLKQRVKDNCLDAKLRELADARQKAIKWLLVTSFGYLGYRNAKFGRLESHEAVTAFGRDKLLTAKELAEDSGFRLINAITDCIFIHSNKQDSSSEHGIKNLCINIAKQTGVEMDIDGVYDWLVFIPSKTDNKTPVSNRYFGKFQDGKMKIRGIAARRKDTAAYIRECQLEFLQLMRQSQNIAHLKKQHQQIYHLFLQFDHKLKNNQVPWQSLLLRKTASRDINHYTVENATALSMRQLADQGIVIQPGEKLRYLVLSHKSRNNKMRYLAEETALIRQKQQQILLYDSTFYRKQLWQAFAEVWQSFAPDGFFDYEHSDQLELFRDWTNGKHKQKQGDSPPAK